MSVVQLQACLSNNSLCIVYINYVYIENEFNVFNTHRLGFFFKQIDTSRYSSLIK